MPINKKKKNTTRMQCSKVKALFLFETNTTTINLRSFRNSVQLTLMTSFSMRLFLRPSIAKLHTYTRSQKKSKTNVQNSAALFQEIVFNFIFFCFTGKSIEFEIHVIRLFCPISLYLLISILSRVKQKLILDWL